jgi:putative ABC transport system permease protein
MTNIIHSLRVLIRDRFHTLINMLGLAIGLTCACLILVYVHNEFSYDRYHVNSERIYRVAQNFITSGKSNKFAVTSPALGPALYKEFPQIESFVRITSTSRILLSYEEEEYYEHTVALADTNIFKVFSYEFLRGDPASCLKNPDNIVISESMSRKYFGETDPMGKALFIENRYPITVTGVFKDPPANSHIQATAFVSYLAGEEISGMKSTDWSMFEITDFTYLLFHTDLDRDALDAGWPEFYKEYLAEDGEEYGQVYELIFHKLEEIHYHSELPGDYPTGNRSFLYTLVFIGIFVLLLAGINYTNMSTAKALQRIREAGIRKVMGANRRSLVSKFLGECFLLSLLTLIIALAAVEFTLEFTSFDKLTGGDLSLKLFQKPQLLLWVAGITILFSVLASIHPAILLSRFPPSETLNRQFSLGPKGMITRRILVSLQTVMGTVAITFTLLAGSQIRFLENSKLGFDQENIMMIPVNDSAMQASMPFILEELKGMPQVHSATTSWSYPGNPSGGLHTFEGKEGMEEHNIPVFFINYNYLETMGIELIQGRDFDPEYGSDTLGSVLINETMAGFMDWDDPLGKKVNQFHSLEAQVVGVVKDFHFRSLHFAIEPLLIRLVRNYGRNLVIRTSGPESSKIVSYMKQKFTEIVPERPFEYYFIDEQFRTQYQNDRMQLKLITIFTMVCIIIASLGILGLVSYSVERRTREIGLRKVNGASSRSIVMQISRRFLWLNLVAFVAAVPISILIFKWWLQEFAYRVRVSPLIILLSLLLVLFISQLTVLLRAHMAARRNPVDSIRYE